jgi:hypothetical protein
MIWQSRDCRTRGRGPSQTRCSLDALVEAYGNYVDANAPGTDLTLFKDVLFNAMDGNAFYAIEQASQQLRDDLRERAYYTHHPVAAE